MRTRAYGSPAELRGVTKVFVDTGDDLELRNYIVDHILRDTNREVKAPTRKVARRWTYHSRVKRSKLPTSEHFERTVADLENRTLPVDLVVIKAHLAAERLLWAILGDRLGVHADSLPPLSFEKLMRLALAGDKYAETRKMITALNDARNRFAHDIEEWRLSDASARLARALAVFWPELDGDGAAELRDRATRTAASLCVGELWIICAELTLEQIASPTKGGRRLVEDTVRRARDIQNEVRELHQRRAAEWSVTHKVTHKNGPPSA